MADHPDPPWRVYAIGRGKRNPTWWFYLFGVFVTWRYDKENGTINFPEWMRPIPDPHNDPEAVEIIKKAKGLK